MDDRNQDDMDSDDSVFVLNNTDILDTSGQARNRTGFNYRTQDKAGNRTGFNYRTQDKAEYAGYSEMRCHQGTLNHKTQSQFDQMFILTLIIMSMTLYMMYCTQRYW